MGIISNATASRMTGGWALSWSTVGAAFPSGSMPMPGSEESVRQDQAGCESQVMFFMECVLDRFLPAHFYRPMLARYMNRPNAGGQDPTIEQKHAVPKTMQILSAGRAHYRTVQRGAIRKGLPIYVSTLNLKVPMPPVWVLKP